MAVVAVRPAASLNGNSSMLPKSGGPPASTTKMVLAGGIRIASTSTAIPPQRPRKAGTSGDGKTVLPLLWWPKTKK